MKSKINGERYIVVSENLSYESIFKTIAKHLMVKVPNKIASRKLMSFVWKLEALRCFFNRKNPQITKETAKTSSQKNKYDNNKIKNHINFKFRTVEEAIKNTAKYLLKFK